MGEKFRLFQGAAQGILAGQFQEQDPQNPFPHLRRSRHLPSVRRRVGAGFRQGLSGGGSRARGAAIAKKQLHNFNRKLFGKCKIRIYEISPEIP